MKTTNTLIIAILLLASTVNVQAQKWSKNKVKGNGTITTKTVAITPYNHLNVVGSMDITLVEGDETSITVTTDENVHEYVEITSGGGVLKISLKNVTSLSTKKGIKITVPFRDLNEVSLVGSGDIQSDKRINADIFMVSLTGSGDITLEINSQQIDAKLTGSGDVSLKGTATNIEIKVSGSGDFDAKNLEADNAEAYVSGSGDATVYAKKSLKARVNGSGDISYKGNPERVDSKVSGSGDIEKM